MNRAHLMLPFLVIFVQLQSGCHTHGAPGQAALLEGAMTIGDKQPVWDASSPPGALPDGRYEIATRDNHCYWFAATSPIDDTPLPLHIEDASGTDIGVNRAYHSTSKWVAKICHPKGGKVFLSIDGDSHRHDARPVLRGWKKPMPAVKSIVQEGTCGSPALLTTGFFAPISFHPSVPAHATDKTEAGGYYVFKIQPNTPIDISGVIYGVKKGGWSISDHCRIDNEQPPMHPFVKRRDHHEFSTTVAAKESYLIVYTTAHKDDMGVWAELRSLPEATLFCENARSVSFEDKTNGRFHFGYAAIDLANAPAFNLFASACDAAAADQAKKYSDTFNPAERLVSFEVNETSRIYIESEAKLISVRNSCSDDEITCSIDGSLRYVATPGRYYMTLNGDTPNPIIHMSPTESEIAATSSFCEETVNLDFVPTLHTYSTYDKPNRLSGSCGGKLAPETIYAFHIKERAIFMAGTTQDGSIGYGYPESDYSKALYLMDGCDSTASEHICANPSEKAAIDIHTILDPGTWYLVIDGKEESEFGEGILYANTTPVKPLERTCARARQLPLNGVVEGEITPTQKQFFPLALNVFTMAWNAQMVGPESVYSLTLSKKKKVTLKLTADFDVHLFIRSDCADIHSEQGYAHAPDGQTELTVTLDAGLYYIFVDTGSASASRSSLKKFTLKSKTTHVQ